MIDDYLEAVERRTGDAGAVELWPRTPIGDEIQDRIRDRVGVDDRSSQDPRSRPARIVAALEELVAHGRIPRHFTLLDIACGDALILAEIAARYPGASCHGLDINVDRFPSHDSVRKRGVVLWRGSLQALVAQRPPAPFDVVLMLNTYRGWESADLRDSERDLPERVDEWLAASANVLVLTATDVQVRRWRRRGWLVDDRGRGEESSRLVVLRSARGLRRAVARLGWR